MSAAAIALRTILAGTALTMPAILPMPTIIRMLRLAARILMRLVLLRLARRDAATDGGF